MKRVLVLYFLFLLPLCLTAQQYPVRHYTMSDGLLHATVYRTFQDKKGFIWFCTDYGVSMFNGKTFKNYTEKEGLCNKAVISIAEDEKGNKIVSTYRGCVNIISDSGITILPGSKKISNLIFSAVPDKGRVWAVTKKAMQELYLLYEDSVKIVPLSYPGRQIIINKEASNKDEILYATSNGIYKIHGDTALPYMHHLFAGHNVYGVAKDKSGGYWVAADKDIVYVKAGEIVESFPHSSTVADLLIDLYGNLWVATDAGELLLRKNGVVRNIVPQLKIPKTVMTDLFEDMEGNIWFTTQGLGVYSISSFDIVNYPAEDDKLNIYCNTIEEIRDDEIWMGSFGTVSQWKQGQVKALPSNIALNEFIYFIKRKDDYVYMGTPNGLLKKSIRPPYTEKKIYARQGAISACIGNSGSTLVGSYDNLYQLRNDSLVLFDSTGVLAGKRCNVIAYDDEGALWIGTDSVAIRYRNGKYSYPEVPGFAHPFKIGRMWLDKHKRMWFSTANGLICKNGESYRVFTEKDGLKDNMVRELFEDEDNNLWVSTFNGINIVDLNTLKIKEFIIGTTLPEIISLYKKGKNLFVGTIEGFTVINTEKLLKSDFVPPLYITSVKTESATYQYPVKIELPYNSPKLQIEFAGLCYRYPEKVIYRYKLQGLDDEWHETENNIIEFPSLPNGSYKFIVNARLGRDTWGQDVVLPVIVATPFWKTWWFASLAVVLATLLMYLVVKKWIVITESRKRRQLLLLNKITYLKQQALSALINPHFIFNCMNSIQHYLYKKDTELASIYLADFAGLIRMTMENSQEVFINLDKEIERIRLYISLEKLRIGEELTYEIIIDHKISPHDIRIPNMILQPFIENSIWHGIMPKKGGGKISIIFETADEKNMRILIKDNGVGIKKSASSSTHPGRKSFGMRLIEDRLQLLNELLNVYYHVTVRPIEENGQLMGTVVEIILPYTPNEKDISVLEAELKKEAK